MTDDSPNSLVGPPLDPYSDSRQESNPFLLVVCAEEPTPADPPSPAEGAFAARSEALVGFKRVARGAVTGFRQQLDRMQEAMRELQYARRIARCKRAIARNPESTTLWTLLALLYEAGGEHEAASECYRHLASVHRERGEMDEVGFCYRKLDYLQERDPARLYRELTNLYAEAGRFDRAGRTCLRVVQLYLAEGHRKAAIGYLRSLPSGDAVVSYTFSELKQILQRPEPEEV